jgi:chromosome segregation ATPase
MKLSYAMFTEMATSKRCSMCKKEMGPMYCTGCDSYFCTKDFRTHREGIVTEMDGIVEERNKLQDEINKAAQRNDQRSPLIAKINEWQEATIEKIKQAAAQARQQVVQLLNSKKVKITTEFQTFSQELAHLKETENFVEHDLTRLKQMIEQFHYDLKQSVQPTNIELHKEQSDEIDWNRVIYVEEKRDRAVNQQRQPQATGKLVRYFILRNHEHRDFFLNENCQSANIHSWA